MKQQININTYEVSNEGKHSVGCVHLKYKLNKEVLIMRQKNDRMMDQVALDSGQCTSQHSKVTRYQAR